MKTIEQKIAELEEKLATEKEKLTKANRAKETRRKVIIGGYILQNEEENAELIEKIKRGLTRSQDRAAFDLEPLKPNGPVQQVFTKDL